MENKIPIKNIYYMLCYAWDRLKEKDIILVENVDGNNLYDLFAKVLINGLTHLIKRGFDREYVSINDDVSCIRGKINFNYSMKKLLWIRGKLSCEFDELSYNVLQNQIIKATLNELFCNEDIDVKIKDRLIDIVKYFQDIDNIKLSKKLFSQVRINRNNHFYRFLIDICETIYDNLLVDEMTGYRKFKDFDKDEKQMAYLFENFLRNFYKRELNGYKVYRENIYWDAKIGDLESLKFLPIMQTDISLESSDRKIIMDAKFKKDVFSYNMEAKKLNSSNLYQIFSYLKNSEGKGGLNLNCEGILLYPTVDEEVNLDYMIQGHKLGIRTVNLNQDWQGIHIRLLEIIYGGVI